MTGISTKRKVSKKTKRSWRKYVDTKDVDAYLENARLEERLGVPFSKRLDSELFTIDTATKNVASKTLPTEINTLSKKERLRIQLNNKEAKCFSALKPHTSVPDPIVKRNRVRTPEERKDPIRKRIEAERKVKGILKLKEKIALRNKALADAKRSCKPKRGEFTKNIWDNNIQDSVDTVDTEWMTSDAMRHTLSHLGVKKRKVPTSLHKKPSVLPTVEVPHPGTSYNPSYDDHQMLLHEIAEKEKELMKQEAHLTRVTTNMFKKVTPEKKEENLMTELSEGLPLKSEHATENSCINNCEDEEDNDPVVKSVNPPVKNMKKTLVMRRKQKEQKALALKLKQQKIEKKKITDLYKLKLIQKQLDVKQQQADVMQEKRQKLKEVKSKETKTLSKVKFEPLSPEFQLAQDLTGNLRSSAPTGSLLKDRYKSLQQRNIVAPGTLILKSSKGKRKRFIKPDHKINIRHTKK